MKYCDLKSKYPDILSFYEKVQELVDAGAGSEMAVENCRMEIEKTIRPEHQQIVIDRLTHFGNLVKEQRK